MGIIGLIPARGGSKGIPRKNLAECAGKPLIRYTIDAAAESGVLDDLYLSTDDEEIAGYARDHGVQAPWLRPPELAGDRTPMIEVVQHFLEWYRREKEEPEGVMLLQPTSPLRTSGHIREAGERFLAERPASLVSVTGVPHNFVPESLMVEKEGRLEHYIQGGGYTRQEKPSYLARNGPAILIMSTNAVDAGDTYAPPCIPYRMDARSSVDVDSPADLEQAEQLLLQDRKGR